MTTPTIGRGKRPNLLEVLQNFHLDSNPGPSIGREITGPSISSSLTPTAEPGRARGRGRGFKFDTEPNDASNAARKSPYNLEPNEYSKPVLSSFSNEYDDDDKRDTKPKKSELEAEPGRARGRGRGIKSDTEPNDASNAARKSPYNLEPNEYSKPVLSSFSNEYDDNDNENDDKKDTKPKKSELEKNSEPVTKLGKTGHAVDLSANYVRLIVDKNHDAFEYRVSFIPKIENKAFKTQMFKEHRDVLGEDLTFDGGATLYLPHILNDDVMTLKSTHPSKKTPVTLKLKFIKNKSCDIMKVFNVLLKRIMITLNHAQIGRACYDTERSISVPQHKLKLLPGYVTAVDFYEGGLMLNLNTLHKVVRAQTVLSEIHELTQNCQNFENAVKKSLVGKTVLAHHSGKLYTVIDVDFVKNPLSEFLMSNGESVSFLKYYKIHYGKELTDLKQPVLISRGQRALDEEPICLLPELCSITGLSDEMRDDPSLMKVLWNHMRITPNRRYRALKDFIELLNSNERVKGMLGNWGLRIDPVPITLSARELKPEDVYFGHSKIVSPWEKADWNRFALMLPVFTPIDINSWVILYTQQNARHVEDFIDCILHCSRSAGIRISPPKLALLRNNTITAYVNKLKEEINQYLQLVVCVCPSKRHDIYSAIKKICSVDFPVPSQVIHGKTLSCEPQKLTSIVHKILLQINCKLGGAPWSVSIPYSKLMVVGLDIFKSEATGFQSVCGFVASYDRSLTKWYSRARFHRSGKEIMYQLEVCFINALKLYFESNGFLPERIIVYRDGVGDEQFDVIKEYEIAQMISCFNAMGSEYSPMFTFIAVQTRNNTRIFTTPSGNSVVDNPNPGTVIDTTITRRFLYDFYVVSHKTIVGSLVPTHYVVLHDTSTMEPDHVQRITFKMCHLYFNQSATIQVPAPCRYAHKLAYLIGTSVKTEHNLRLADKLFFL